MIEEMLRQEWLDERMLTVVLVVLALAGVWALAAVACAFLTGGVIHARDHEDAPIGGFPRSRPVAPFARPRPRV